VAQVVSMLLDQISCTDKNAFVDLCCSDDEGNSVICPSDYSSTTFVKKEVFSFPVTTIHKNSPFVCWIYLCINNIDCWLLITDGVWQQKI